MLDTLSVAVALLLVVGVPDGDRLAEPEIDDEDEGVRTWLRDSVTLEDAEELGVSESDGVAVALEVTDSLALCV